MLSGIKRDELSQASPNLTAANNKISELDAQAPSIACHVCPKPAGVYGLIICGGCSLHHSNAAE